MSTSLVIEQPKINLFGSITSDLQRCKMINRLRNILENCEKRQPPILEA